MTIDVARSVKKMFVDGRWVESESGAFFDADSPATGEVIAQVPKGTRADAQRAVEAAHRARAAMAQLKGFERSKRLHKIAEAIEKRRDELGKLLTLDQGKPLKAEALGEVDECTEYFRIAAEDLKRLEGRVLPSASPTKLVFARRLRNHHALELAADDGRRAHRPGPCRGQHVRLDARLVDQRDLGRADGVHR